MGEEGYNYSESADGTETAALPEQGGIPVADGEAPVEHEEISLSPEPTESESNESAKLNNAE
jgi:hypothetical protein